MSTCPGDTLEEYVMWDLDLIVDGDRSANPSLMLAEAMGVNTRRKAITGLAFKDIVAVYEPYRRDIESKLSSYWHEDDQPSWRDYAGYAFNFVPDAIREQASALVITASSLGTCQPE